MVTESAMVGRSRIGTAVREKAKTKAASKSSGRNVSLCRWRRPPPRIAPAATTSSGPGTLFDPEAM